MIGVLIYSCQNEFETESISPLQQVESENVTKPKNMIKLGKKLENPYSVVNMQRALDTILQEVKKSSTQQARAFRQTSEEIEIKTTDLYVRFLPKDSLELDLIKKDTTLFLYDHPLDYEIEKQGDYYHDPNLEENQITWQYTVVKPDYQFPEIKHEILSELFIPENSEEYYEEENNQGRRMYSKTYNLDKLETVALYLTNNLSEQEKTQIEEEEQAASRARRACIWFVCWNEPDPWNPSGYVRIQDTERGWIAIKGVKVSARRWFTTKYTYTNSNGYYKTGSFKRPANYKITFERYQFTIRESFWGVARAARVDGPKKKGSWNVYLYKNTQDWFEGTIFMAAYHYYYQYIKGLKRPPQNAWWKPQMKIRAYYFENYNFNGTHDKNYRLFGVFARIKIYNPHHRSSEIYATTIHELAHASHWELRKNNWRNTDRKVRESWARGVEWELTRMKYPSSNYIGREWNNDKKDYTLVVADMIDTESTSFTNNGFVNPEDRVSGYTIKQIENVLSYTSSWNNWRDNIKSRYSNSTEYNLDRLFKSYE